jgi:hypothetical protein
MCTYNNCREFDNVNTDTGKVKVCTACWTKEDVSDWDNWPARASYPRRIFYATDDETPFETHGDECRLKCRTGYHLEYDDRNTDQRLSQLCVYDGCLTWDIFGYTVGEDPSATSIICTSCWTPESVDDDSWSGASVYLKIRIEGRNPSVPFIVDTKSEFCALQCDKGYWSNLYSEILKAPTPLDQKCTFNNCKEFYDDRLDAGVSSKSCKTCWTEEDVADWEKLPIKSSYPKRIFYGTDPIEPFKMDDTNCKLKCKIGYHFSIDTRNDVPRLAQSCIYNGCMTSDV